MLGTPTRDRKAERRAAVRREILDAAWDIARESGVTQITLRDVASRIGMQAPSLYTHFDSKMAIYDAMFGEAWEDYGKAFAECEATLSTDPRTALNQVFRHFYDYAIADHARYQLMNERVIPSFEPTAEAYASSVSVFERGHRVVTGVGDISDADFLIFMSLVGGLVNQHLANDPGGTRVTAVIDRAVDMWADAVGLPPSPA